MRRHPLLARDDGDIGIGVGADCATDNCYVIFCTVSYEHLYPTFSLSLPKRIVSPSGLPHFALERSEEFRSVYG